MKVKMLLCLVIAAIAIMGNPKMIDLKKLEKYGKVVKINASKLFSTKDTLF